jgi:prevent-host-death family protein
MATRPKPVPNVIPALTARTQLGQILKRVHQNNERFVVHKRGQPQAVIMSVEEYLRVFSHPPAIVKRMWRIARAKKLNSMSLREINAEIKRYRRERRAKNA